MDASPLPSMSDDDAAVMVDELVPAAAVAAAVPKAASTKPNKMRPPKGAAKAAAAAREDVAVHCRHGVGANGTAWWCMLLDEFLVWLVWHVRPQVIPHSDCDRVRSQVTGVGTAIGCDSPRRSDPAFVIPHSDCDRVRSQVAGVMARRVQKFRSIG